MRVAFAHGTDDQDWVGGRNYLSTLFRSVREVAADDVEIVLFTGPRTATSLPEEFPYLEIVRTPIMDRWSLPWLWRKARSRLAPDRDPSFASLMRRHRIDVLSHAWGLAHSGIKTLGWLPDFQFLHLPEYWSPRNLRTVQRMYRSACRSCDALVVSSRDARADLDAFAPSCKLPKHVLPFISTPVEVDRLRARESLCRQYGLPPEYFIVPNQFWAHKNHRVVIDALALLKEQGTSVTIACTGHTGDFRRPAHFDNLMAHCRSLGVSANFKVLGLIPYSDVQGLMAHAQAVINPSRFEGWSTTVEEAKTMGKRILLSDIRVHREQAPADADYFPTDDPGTLARLLKESSERDHPEAGVDEVARNYSQSLRDFGAAYVRILREL